VGGKSERVARETVEGAGREERVWLEGVARVAPGYTLRALVGFSRRYIPCRGHHSGPPICTDSARVVRRHTYTREHQRACNPAWIRRYMRRSAHVCIYLLSDL